MMTIAQKPAPVFTRTKPFPKVMLEVGHSYEGIQESVADIPADAVIESVKLTEDGKAVVIEFTEAE